MWIILGLAAILFAALNLIRFFQGKSEKWFRFISLSLTALTVCMFYSDAAAQLAREDWAGLRDVMPTMRTALWICTAASILINSISLFEEKR